MKRREEKWVGRRKEGERSRRSDGNKKKHEEGLGEGEAIGYECLAVEM